jgi:hypothetical protein
VPSIQYLSFLFTSTLSQKFYTDSAKFTISGEANSPISTVYLFIIIAPEIVSIEPLLHSALLILSKRGRYEKP